MRLGFDAERLAPMIGVDSIGTEQDMTFARRTPCAHRTGAQNKRLKTRSVRNGMYGLDVFFLCLFIAELLEHQG